MLHAFEATVRCLRSIDCKPGRYGKPLSLSHAICCLAISLGISPSSGLTLSWLR